MKGAIGSNGKPMVDCPALHAAFKINHRPDKFTMEELAREAGLQVQQVESWFSRARAKHGTSFVGSNRKGLKRTWKDRTATTSEEPAVLVRPSHPQVKASSSSSYPTTRTSKKRSGNPTDTRQESASPTGLLSASDLQPLPHSASCSPSHQHTDDVPLADPSSSASSSPVVRPRKKIKTYSTKAKRGGIIRPNYAIQTTSPKESSGESPELLDTDIEKYFVEVNLGVRPIQPSSPTVSSFPPALQEWINATSVKQQNVEASALRPFAEAAPDAATSGSSGLYYSDSPSSPSSSAYEDVLHTSNNNAEHASGGLGSPIKLWQELPDLSSDAFDATGWEAYLTDPTLATGGSEVIAEVSKQSDFRLEPSTGAGSCQTPSYARGCLSRAQNIVWTDWLVPSQERKALPEQNSAKLLPTPPSIIVTSASPNVSLEKYRFVP